MCKFTTNKQSLYFECSFFYIIVSRNDSDATFCHYSSEAMELNVRPSAWANRESLTFSRSHFKPAVHMAC